MTLLVSHWFSPPREPTKGSAPLLWVRIDDADYFDVVTNPLEFDPNQRACRFISVPIGWDRATLFNFLTRLGLKGI